jgi:ATP-dependent protease HslVU (ClpYQ) peptidase subunit
MSIVIAIKEKNRIVMGCDSQVSCGYLKEKLDNKNCCKIWEVENCKNGLMGCVGSLRDLQVIQCEENLIDKLKQFEGKIDYKYVVNNLTDKMYDILCHHRCVNKDNHGNCENYMNSQFIFAYKDMAYLISNFLEITPIGDYLVIGCGDQIATGILENNKNKTAEERIREVIKSCADKSNGIDNNIVIKNT